LVKGAAPGATSRRSREDRDEPVGQVRDRLERHTGNLAASRTVPLMGERDRTGFRL